MSPSPGDAPVRLGLRQNLAQFGLLVGINALVGAALGQERTVLPLLAAEEFHLDAYSSALTFILAFGLAKAATNYLAGAWSDRVGRKPVLVTGWVVAVPVPILLIWAPAWGWVILANVLLGVSQGLRDSQSLQRLLPDPRDELPAHAVPRVRSRLGDHHRHSFATQAQRERKPRQSSSCDPDLLHATRQASTRRPPRHDDLSENRQSSRPIARASSPGRNPARMLTGMS